MQRIALKALLEWKSSQIHHPLIIRGARQVGKTWLIRKLSEGFESFIEINLEARFDLHQVFKDNFGNPKELIKKLKLYFPHEIIPGKTLFFLDEVQGCKEAIQSLRYFKEQLPELHVVAAGSLLEFTLHEISFPVGRVQFLHIFPMNFEEFLMARGHEIWVQALLANEQLPEAIENKIQNELQIYLNLGGLPEVLKTFLTNEDWDETQNILQGLVASYREDFQKYASRAQVEYLKILLDSIPRWIGQKWVHTHVTQEIKSREINIGLELLKDAGLIRKVFHTSANGVPLGAEIKPSNFKVYMHDIGVCQRALGLNLRQMAVSGINRVVNAGWIGEQFISQEMASYTQMNESPDQYYWHREERGSQSEVDFVISHEGIIIPLEVKTSATAKGRSLIRFLDEKKLKRGIRVCLKSNPGAVGARNNIETWLMTHFFAEYRRLKSGM